MAQRATEEQIREACEKRGCKFVRMYHRGKRQNQLRVVYFCPSGHERDLKWTQFHTAIRCKLCALTQLHDRLTALAKSEKWEFPEGLPTTPKDTLLVRCPCHAEDALTGDPALHAEGYFEWRPRVYDLLKGKSRCSYCTGGKNVRTDLARLHWKLSQDAKAQMQGRIRGPITSKTRISLACLRCRRSFASSVHAVVNGHYGCQRCGYKRVGERLRIDPRIVHKRCNELGHRNISLEYNDGALFVRFVCRNGKEHTQAWGSMRTRNACGCATFVSSYEHIVGQLLVHVTGYQCRKIQKRELMKLVGATTAPKEADFYIRELGVFIEVDGGFHVTSAKVQRCDRAKDRWFKKHGLLLIRLPLDWLDRLKAETARTQVSMMLEVLRRYAVPCRRPKKPFQVEYNPDVQSAGLQRMRELAQSVDCTLVSQQFLGMKEPHLFRCAGHGEFQRRPQDMLRKKKGCPRCSLDQGAKLCASTRISSSKQRFIELCGSDYDMLTEFKGQIVKLDCRCRKHRETFSTRPSDCLQQGKILGCLQCARERRSVGYAFPSASEWRRECRRRRVHNESAYRLARKLGLFGRPMPYSPVEHYGLTLMQLFQKTSKESPPWQYTDEHDNPVDLKNHPNANARRLPSGKLRAMPLKKSSQEPANENAIIVRLRGVLRDL